MYTVACATDETKRLTLCFHLVAACSQGTFNDAKGFNCTGVYFVLFLVLPRFDFKTFHGQPAAVLAINQSIN